MEEIEVNFRLDSNGRTTMTQNNVEEINNADNKESNTANESNNEKKEKNITLANVSKDKIDYRSKAVMTNFAIIDDDLNNDNNNNQDSKEGNKTKSGDCEADADTVSRKILDDLLYDCEITDCGLMPRTFWMPCEGMEPRCTLEEFALNIFHYHVPKNLDYDRSKSGAEWWAQIRPSPEGTGRYSMHDDTYDNDEFTKNGITFHWDKDEDLRLLTGGTTYIHPHISTVTYLTDFGSPTLIFNCRIHSLTGEWIVPDTNSNGNHNDDDDDSHVEGFVSWPKTGKHTSFDGRYLHSAPPDLMEPGLFEKQIQFDQTIAADDVKQKQILKRRHRRVTFLVNIWLNYKPFNVEPFPGSMIDKLSGHNTNNKTKSSNTNGDADDDGNHGSKKEKENMNRKISLNFIDMKKNQSKSTKVRSVITTLKSVQEEVDNNSNNTNNKIEDNGISKHNLPIKFTWPMGDCNSNEKIQVQMPLTLIRDETANGGNIKIRWEGGEEEEKIKNEHDENDNNKNKNDIGKEEKEVCFRLYREEEEMQTTSATKKQRCD